MQCNDVEIEPFRTIKAWTHVIGARPRVCMGEHVGHRRSRPYRAYWGVRAIAANAFGVLEVARTNLIHTESIELPLSVQATRAYRSHALPLLRIW